MKKVICIFIAFLMLAGAALGEEVVIEDISVETAAIDTETDFEGECFSLTLPGKLTILTGEESALYAAAVLADYPDAPDLELTAVDGERSAVVCAAALESEKSALEAAQAAAETLLKKKDVVVETQFGENACACFGCAIDGVNYNIYVFSAEGALVCLGIAGLGDAETTAILTSLTLKKS